MDKIGIRGVISLHAIPDWTDEELAYMWTPETTWDPKRGWVITRQARVSEGEKRSRRIRFGNGKYEVENLITNTGIALLLSNISVTGQGSMEPFFQILSVGNGALTGVTRSDTAVSGDGFISGARKAPASFSVVGFQTTVVTNYASGDGVGTWTNIGAYGYKVASSQNATTSTGTGALMTHALFNYVKGASAIALNYVFILSN